MNENENQNDNDDVPAKPDPIIKNEKEPIEPMPDNPGLVTTFETLLKKPVTLVDAMLKGDASGKIVTNLIITAVGSLAVFGLIIGTVSMGAQLWAAPLKISLGMLVAGLICLPSLYIFACLNGLDVKISSAAGVLFAMICMTALLLLGFAPVVWIFSQSTNSIVFMGGLALAFWAVAIYFGLGVLSRTAEHLGMKGRSHLVVWMGIFIMVGLQMTTSLRPIVGKSDKFFTTEKKFFLTHWTEQVEKESRRVITPQEQARANPEGQ